MKSLVTDRSLTIINFSIVVYFLLIWLVNLYQLDIVLIGVFGELLTIPFLLAQIVFLIIGIRYVLTHQRNFLTILSVVLLAISAFITIGSFFI